MKRKSILFFIVITAVVVSLLAFKAVNARRTGSGTTRVSIDGRSFLVKTPSMDSRSAMLHELARLGIDVPENLIDLGEIRSIKPVIPENLPTAQNTSHKKQTRMPEGFNVDHTLEMSGENGTVEMLMGTVKQANGSAAARLESNQWIRSEISEDRNFPKTFRKNRGKETDIVWLDEKKGIFLLLRRLER
ncbi:MAG: hypothetical protein FWF95_02415 [Syntrophorhabdaceae bacterium]|nr:hypothetical protein [Syntrophorhabdaceae bacterium]